MIVRLWRGWTAPEDAQAYQELLEGEIIPGILARGVPGFRDIHLLRRDPGGPGDVEDVEDVEFVTVMSFDDWEAVADFAGQDPTVAVVPPAARRLLRRYDQHSAHYTSVSRRTAQS